MASKLPESTKSCSLKKFAAKNKKLLKRKVIDLCVLKAQHSDLQEVGRTVMSKKSSIINKTKDKLLTNPEELDECDLSDESDDEGENIFMKVNLKIPSALLSLNTNVYIRLHAEKLVEIIKTWSTERYSAHDLEKWQKKMEQYYMEHEMGIKLITAFTIKHTAEDSTPIKDYILGLLTYLKPFPSFVKDIKRKLLQWRAKTLVMYKIMHLTKRTCTQHKVYTLCEIKLQEEELEGIPLDEYSQQMKKKIISIVKNKGKSSTEYHQKNRNGGQNRNRHQGGGGGGGNNNSNNQRQSRQTQGKQTQRQNQSES